MMHFDGGRLDFTFLILNGRKKLLNLSLMLDSASGAVPLDSQSERYDDFPMPIYSLHAENRKLVDMNRDLMSQVQVLQSQFDDALTITDDLKGRFMGHHNTLRELQAVKIERDDLQERLSICQRCNDDLHFEIQKLRERQQPQVTVSVPPPTPAPDKSLITAMETLKKQIQNLENENTQLRQAKIETKNSSSERIDKLISAISRFVGRSFANDTEVINFLSNERDTYDSVHKKIKKQKQLTSELQDKLRARDRTVDELNHEKDTIERQLTSEIHSLRRRNQEISEELATPRMISSSISPVKAVTIMPTPSVIPAKNVISESHCVESGDDTNEEITHQREMISNLEDERNKLQNLLERQTTLTCSLEKKVKQQEDEEKKMTAELRQAQAKVRKLSKYEHNSPKIPLSIWMCPEFPEDLAKIIEDLAKNKTLQLPTKIRHALTTTTNWFLSREEAMERQWREDKVALQDLRRNVDSFAEYLQHLCQIEIDFQKVITDEQVRSSFGRELVMMKNQLNDLKEEVRQWNDVQKLLNHMSPVDATERVRELIENEEKLAKELAEEQKMHEEEIAKLEADMEKLVEDNQAREANLRQRNEDLQQEMEKLKMFLVNEEDLVTEAGKKYAGGISQQIQDIKTQLETVSSEKLALAEEIEQCKRVISHLSKKRQNAEKKLATVKEQLQEQQQKLTNKFKREKAKLEKRISELTEMLQTQSNECQKAILELNEQLDTVNSEKVELANKVSAHILTMQRMETKMSNAAAQYEREKHQLMSECTTKIQLLQSEYEHKSEQDRAAAVHWKVMTYEKINTLLSRHLNGVKRVDDNNIDAVLQVLKRKLDSATLTDQLIRSHFGIGAYDSIDEAFNQRQRHKKSHKHC